MAESSKVESAYAVTSNVNLSLPKGASKGRGSKGITPEFGQFDAKRIADQLKGKGKNDKEKKADALRMAKAWIKRGIDLKHISVVIKEGALTPEAPVKNGGLTKIWSIDPKELEGKSLEDLILKASELAADNNIKDIPTFKTIPEAVAFLTKDA